MNYAFLLGGFVGFVLTFVATSMSGDTWVFALRDGMIGCFIVAYLFKLLSGLVDRAAAEAREANRLREGSDG